MDSTASGRPDPLRITRSDGTPPTVHLDGELDLATCDRVRAALIDAPDGLVVDLTALDFVDSSGLHALLDAHLAAVDAGRSLSFRPGARRVQRALEIAGLLSVLSFETDGHDAPSATGGG